MANISPGFFSNNIGSSTPREPMQTPATNPVMLSYIARFIGNFLGAGGNQNMSGRTYDSGLPASRRVVIMTQPPNAALVYESDTLPPGALFSFPRLPPGKYVVIDVTPDGSQQALVYDWVEPV